jgi:hypothetical protein
MEEPQITGQMNAELEFSGRLEGLAQQAAPARPAGSGGTGVLPIQIQVPTSGQVYRFAKTIVKPEDPLTFDVSYSRAWVSGSIKWIIIVLIALLLYLNRGSLGRLGRWLGGRWQRGVGLYKKHERAITKVAQSHLTPFVLIGLVFLSWPLFRFLSLVFFFLFWVSMAYHLLEYTKKRAQPKKVPVKRPTKE